MIIDPSIYNAPTFEPVLGDAGSDQAAAQYVPPAEVPQSTVLGGTESIQIGQTENVMAARERAGSFQSIKAAASEWGTRHVYDYYTGPSFEPVQDFNAAELVQASHMSLSEEERDFLLQTRSPEEYDHKEEVIQRQRKNALLAGDNPVLSFITGMADPIYLGAGGFGAVVGRAAAIGRVASTAVPRVVSAAAGAGSSYGIGKLEQQAAAVSEMEIVAGALVEGAAAGMLYRKGVGSAKVDPEYPSELLTSLASSVKLRNPDQGVLPSISFTAPDGAMRTGSELVENISPVFKGTEYEALLNVLRDAPELKGINVSTGKVAQSLLPKARGFYSTGKGKNMLFIREGVEADVPLHELTHAVVQPRLLADPVVVRELQAMQANVAQALGRSGDPASKFLATQTSKNLNEFIAYAYTSPTFRKWAQQEQLDSTGAPASVGPAPDVARPVVPTGTVWDRMVDWFAAKLGIQPPLAKRVLESKAAQGKWDEVANNSTFKSLDTRMQELLQQTARATPPNLYTRGVLKNVDPSMSEVVLRGRISKLGDREYVGSWISWSLHKTLGSYSDKSREAADLLVDNPLDMTNDSVVSQARAVRADLSHLQFEYEDLFTKELAKRGAGIKNRIFKPRESIQIQQKLEKELQVEMLRRERNTRLGMATESRASKEVQAMADKLDDLYAKALKEMQAAGVSGADAVAESSGYFSRKWDVSNIDEAKNRLINAGHTLEEANKKLVQIVQQGIRRANGWDADLSRDVAKAILDRAHRKGYFEDAAFRSHAGNEAAKEVRDILTSAGIRGDRLQRAMDVLTGVVDEAGKMSTLKHRIDIDMKAGIALPDGTTLTVSDLINSDLTRSTEAYLDQVSGRIAMARKGLPDVSDIDKLRTEVLESIPTVSARGEAAQLFDSTMDSILGRPTGEDVPNGLRNLQAVTRMVGLASSALWQVTEYAPAMARYGALRTLKHAMKEATFSAIRRPDRATSMQLVDVLSRNSSADIRLRPFINRMEDNFEVPAGNVVQAALLQAQQLVPYVNAQKYIQTHQARTVANLVVDTFRMAGDGDQKAIKALEGYGLEPHIVTQIQPELRAAGMDTSKWSDETWAAVRGPLTKMMDDSVLRNRTGEIPAFAQFTQVGKFIFTFRSFVLGAHNKVLAGTISRDGMAGISLLMLYQFPLVLLATQANSTMQGKEIKDTGELISKAFGQMGSLGLFSELFGVMSGQKQQFGAPGLIAVDRLYKLAGDMASLDGGDSLSGALQATPILSIIPGTRAIGEALKD